MIDTLSIVEILTDAGIEPRQAKAHAQAIAHAVSEKSEDSDLADLKAGIAANRAGIVALKWISTAIALTLLAVVFAGGLG